MKKACVIILLAAALLAGCAGADTPEQNLPPGEITGAVTDREVHEFGAEGQVNSTIILGTLELAYAGENAAAAAVNADLRAMLDAYLNATADEDAMFYTEDPSLFFTHERAYALAYLGDQYISVVAAGYDDSPTAAHANIYRLAYVYDRQTGERVCLADLLDAGYEELIAAAIAGQITAAGEGDNYYPGYADQIKAVLAEENWYIKDGTIYVIFNPYQIAPPSLGILEFPYDYTAE